MATLIKVRPPRESVAGDGEAISSIPLLALPPGHTFLWRNQGAAYVAIVGNHNFEDTWPEEN